MAITFPDLDPVALQLGPVAIRWYGLSYAATFLVGFHYIAALLKRPTLWAGRPTQGLDVKLDALMLYIVIGVIVGGRIGHILFYQAGYYFSHPLEMFAIWKGGMSFHGGLIGTIIGILAFAANQRTDKWLIGDLIAATTPIGVFFVRMANFVNAEIIGSPSTAPWAIVFPGYDEPRHPA
ncbi:MAG: prolipoprotein diacylglyceryl transferase, partial [Pseudomonadota bacterium]